MHVLVLGSGGAGGIPAWNDGGPLALRARGGDPAVPRREIAALAVSADGVRYALLEAPLHLAGTLTRSARFAPTPGSRAVAIDSIVLTSADLEACAGLLGLGAGALSIRILSSRGVREALVEADAGFRSQAPVWSGLPWDRALPLDREERLEARLFPLPGPVPDFLRESAPQAGRGRCGVRITDRSTGLRLVWAPRLARLDTATLAELRAADLRFVDGTFCEGSCDDGCGDESEARALRPGVRSAQDLGHLPVEGSEGSLAWLSGMSGESIYVHLAGTNPLCDSKSPASERVRAAGVEVAFDGMGLER